MAVLSRRILEVTAVYSWCLSEIALKAEHGVFYGEIKAFDPINDWYKAQTVT